MQLSTFGKKPYYPQHIIDFSKKLIAFFYVLTSFVAAVAFTSAFAFAPIAAAQSVTVVEYYNRPLDAYFITGRSAEQSALDALPADFSRTGMEFTATHAAAASASQVRICRFFISLNAPFTSSHFYGREGLDCEAIRTQNPAGFTYEEFDFAVVSPSALGACPATASTRVFRSFRVSASGRTSNHRYTVSQASYDAQNASGWSPESVAFCVTAAKDSTQLTTSSFKRVVSPAQSPFAAGCSGAPAGVNYAGAEVEPSLARHPTNPKHMVAAWQQDRWSNGGSQGLASAASFDGGLTWQSSLAIFSRCSGGNAANRGDYERASDPWVAIASDGTAYQMALSFSGQSFTANGISAMLVARSVDGGRTWAAPQVLVRDASATVFHDKNMIVADPSDPAYVYAIWGRLDTVGGGHGPAWFTRTTDGGISWEAARSIYEPGAANQTFGNQLVVLPNGVLINVFLDIIRSGTAQSPSGQRMRVVRSTDKGASWSAPITIASYLGVGTVDSVTRDPVRDGAGTTSMAVGADGRLHVVWQDSRFSAGAVDAIAYSQSFDGGLTWSAPTQINASGGVAAFTPTVHVRADGTIGVSFYDFSATRTTTSTLPTVYKLVQSTDGIRWSVSEINSAFDLRKAPVARGYFLGDYQGLSSNGNAFAALYGRTTASASSTDINEIVFAHVADGSLKRAPLSFEARYAAVPAPVGFLVTPELQKRVSESIDRAVQVRREKRAPLER